MATYTYSRETLNSGDYINKWDINNPNRVDGGDEQIHLSQEIMVAIPAVSLAACAILCNGSTCEINFDQDLDGSQKTTLDTTVSNHKNNI